LLDRRINGGNAPIPAICVEAMRHDRSELKPPAAGWRCWIALGARHADVCPRRTLPLPPAID